MPIAEADVELARHGHQMDPSHMLRELEAFSFVAGLEKGGGYLLLAVGGG